MGQRRFRFRWVTVVLVPVILLSIVAPLVRGAEESVCPKCSAPREAGAAFCGQCGHKYATAALPVPGVAPSTPGAGPGPGRVPGAGIDARRAVVQVVAAHDKELTSTFVSIVYESNVRIDSILGSAFAVAPGEFMTDSGLLTGAKEVVLRTASGRSVPARIVGIDPLTGVALMRADLAEIGALALRSDEAARAGETVTALGFSSEAANTGDPVVSTGVVSGLHRGGERIHPIEDYLQSDVSLPFGLAGGPWLDDRGRVVGMSTGHVLGSRVYLGRKSGIGFAIPAEWLSRGLAWLRAGSPPRPWTGVYAVPADPDRRSRSGLPEQVKLIVEHVFEDSPAAAAGLKPGDGILKVDDLAAAALPPIHEKIVGMKTGDRVTLHIVRRDSPTAIPIVLATRPGRPRLSGVDALRLFADLHIEANRDSKPVIARIEPGTEPARRKFAPGDVLLSVLSKKDWEHGARDNSRWRSVDTIAELETRMATAWSQFDFAVGLRFRRQDGSKREMYIWEILTPTAAF